MVKHTSDMPIMAGFEDIPNLLRLYSDKITIRQKIAVIAHIYGSSFVDIAKKCKCSPANVRSHFCKGVEKLRDKARRVRLAESFHIEHQANLKRWKSDLYDKWFEKMKERPLSRQVKVLTDDQLEYGYK